MPMTNEKWKMENGKSFFRLTNNIPEMLRHRHSLLIGNETRKSGLIFHFPFTINNIPDILRLNRHIQVSYSKRRQRIDDRADDGGCGANGSGFADALDAKWID